MKLLWISGLLGMLVIVAYGQVSPGGGEPGVFAVQSAPIAAPDLNRELTLAEYLALHRTRYEYVPEQSLPSVRNDDARRSMH